MLLQAYVDAILTDADLADMVWTLWNRGALTDAGAEEAWLMISASDEDQG